MTEPLPDYRRKQLEKRLGALVEDHQAASSQLAHSLSEVDRNRINRQIVDLEKQIQDIERKLDSGLEGNGGITGNGGREAGCSGVFGRFGFQVQAWYRELPDTAKAVIFVAVIVASIGLVALPATQILTRPPIPTPTLTPFAYMVRVRADSTGRAVNNAQVTIEVPGRTPLDEFSDVNGLAVLNIPAAYVNQTGKLIVEAAGFEVFRQNITLQADLLPDEVRLAPAALTSAPTDTPTATSATPTTDASLIAPTGSDRTPACPNVPPAPDLLNTEIPGVLEIISPRDGQEVMNAQEVSGTYSGLPPDHSIWILVYTSWGRWLPQSSNACAGEHTIVGEDRWQVTSSFQTNRTGGDCFTVVAVVADPVASEFFEDKQREYCVQATATPTFKWIGLRTTDLPSGIAEKDRIQVVHE